MMRGNIDYLFSVNANVSVPVAGVSQSVANFSPKGSFHSNALSYTCRCIEK
jgi:hypothetical protein